MTAAPLSSVRYMSTSKARPTPWSASRPAYEGTSGNYICHVAYMERRQKWIGILGPGGTVGRLQKLSPMREIQVKLGLSTIARLGATGTASGQLSAPLDRGPLLVLGTYGSDRNGDTALRAYGLHELGPDETDVRPNDHAVRPSEGVMLRAIGSRRSTGQPTRPIKPEDAR